MSAEKVLSLYDSDVTDNGWSLPFAFGRTTANSVSAGPRRKELSFSTSSHAQQMAERQSSLPAAASASSSLSSSSFKPRYSEEFRNPNFQIVDSKKKLNV